VIVEIPEWPSAVREALQELDGVVQGPQTQRLWTTLQRVAKQDLPLVVEGESGTGKEIVASALHRMSGRQGRFVAVNCAAQAEGLFEATFFGHVKGAFTGAAHASDGLFAEADKGTLFLDEVIELTATQQAKILRAVEEGAVMPVGATRQRPVDVRIVCAAQRSLGLLADEGKFRPDLYARLSGLTVRLTPLRERREEILRLFNHALAKTGGKQPTLSASFVEGLCTHGFRLNVRELVAAARRCHALYPDLTELGGRHLSALLDEHAPANPSDPNREPAEGESAPAAVLSPKAARARHSRQLLEQLNQSLAACGGNLSEAARKIGLSRHQANRLLQAAKQD
jgi:two-component system response regulator FlrC